MRGESRDRRVLGELRGEKRYLEYVGMCRRAFRFRPELCVADGFAVEGCLVGGRVEETRRCGYGGTWRWRGNFDSSCQFNLAQIQRYTHTHIHIRSPYSLVWCIALQRSAAHRNVQRHYSVTTID